MVKKGKGRGQVQQPVIPSIVITIEQDKLNWQIKGLSYLEAIAFLEAVKLEILQKGGGQGGQDKGKN
jgi:hypothetical protein